MTQDAVDISKFDHYSDIIQAELERRQKTNRNFSLRAFARVLAISPSTLSEIIRKKHGISRSLAEKIILKLGYQDRERQYFINLFDFIHSQDMQVRDDAYIQIQAYRDSCKLTKIEQNDFQLISHWYHLAILELIKLNNFKFDYDWIAGQLGISTLEAMSAVGRLKQIGLLKVSKGKLTLEAEGSDVSPPIDDEALNRFLRQCLEKCIDAIRYRPQDDRYIGTAIVAIDEDDLPELRRKMKAFKNDLAQQLAAKPKKSKLYCIASVAFDLLAAVEGKRANEMSNQILN